ncbi:BTH_I0359 family protein [Pseudoduganella sp. OTU4001]|uniref:BTH_I0359 family protein n=1 Tax=Pseudoduganella sp. OTU4001 TaxID=3043854 RepID=UPI00313AF237
MNLIYNSEQYSVVEFGADRSLEALRFGGYEIVDKGGKREIFIAGVMAQTFRRDVNELIASEPTIEEIDDFLGSYEALMSQPVLLH